MALDRKGRNGLSSLWHALGCMAVAGLPVRFASFWDGYRPAIAISSDAGQPPPSRLPVRATVGRTRLRRAGMPCLRLCRPPRRQSLLQSCHRSRPVLPCITAIHCPEVTPMNRRFPHHGRYEAAREGAYAIPGPLAPERSPPGGMGPSGMGTSVSSGRGPDWFIALQDIQGRIIETHQAAQAAMVESLTATLRSLETLSLRGFGWQSGQEGLQPGSVPLSPPEEQRGQPVAMGARSSPTQPVGSGPSAFMQPPPSLPERSTASTAESIPPQSVPGTEVLQAVVLAVVAEKTGYPEEVLRLDMELETGLGIDSIKRGEIFTALLLQGGRVRELRGP